MMFYVDHIYGLMQMSRNFIAVLLELGLFLH